MCIFEKELVKSFLRLIKMDQTTQYIIQCYKKYVLHQWWKYICRAIFVLNQKCLKWLNEWNLKHLYESLYRKQTQRTTSLGLYSVYLQYLKNHLNTKLWKRPWERKESILKKFVLKKTWMRSTLFLLLLFTVQGFYSNFGCLKHVLKHYNDIIIICPF